MAQIEITLPNDKQAQFERLAAEEFLTEERAIEGLLSVGLEAYRDVADRTETEVERSLFSADAEDEYGQRGEL
ncbi:MULTISPECIES: cell surface protein [Haloprofundus]|uniref:cell surface protein n=1 Tax=Haloprofundus TaxID=1911573 RepID=UPI000E450900|nr:MULTISPECIES: cell surface protein [Haloprofundus]QCJ46716.1 cell surface protein [Haloprofundus sp. MHR1]